MSDESIPRFDPKRRRAVTAALLLVTALASFEGTVVSTAMPTIIGDLAGLPLYSWVFSVYLLTSTVMMPLYGRLADIYGRRRILLVAIFVFLVGAVACSMARSMPQLIVARGIQGLGAAGLIPIALTVSADIFSLEERARVQSLFSAVWGFASLVGPLLGAWMTISLGWRSIFAINVPLGILAAALVWTKMIESRSALPDPVDLAGTLTMAGGMTALLFAVLRTPKDGAVAAPSISLLLLAAVLIAAFVRLQARRAHPLIPPDLFRRWATASPYVAGVLLGTTIFGVSTFVPLYVQGARGGTASSAGAVITPLILMWAVSAAVAARFVVRSGFRSTARAGALLCLVGLGGLILAAFERAGVGWISLACGVIGSGLGPSSLAQILTIQALVPERRRGVATSLVPFSRTVGGSVGVGALGGILAAGLASRLGPAAEQAGALLAGPEGAGRAPVVAPAVFREAIEGSLFPIFVVVGALAVVNVFVASAFPRRAIEAEQVIATEAIV